MKKWMLREVEPLSQEHSEQDSTPGRPGPGTGDEEGARAVRPVLCPDSGALEGPLQARAGAWDDGQGSRS